MKAVVRARRKAAAQRAHEAGVGLGTIRSDLEMPYTASLRARVEEHLRVYGSVSQSQFATLRIQSGLVEAAADVLGRDLAWTIHDLREDGWRIEAGRGDAAGYVLVQAPDEDDRRPSVWVRS